MTRALGLEKEGLNEFKNIIVLALEKLTNAFKTDCVRGFELLDGKEALSVERATLLVEKLADAQLNHFVSDLDAFIGKLTKEGK